MLSVIHTTCSCFIWLHCIDHINKTALQQALTLLTHIIALVFIHYPPLLFLVVKGRDITPSILIAKGVNNAGMIYSAGEVTEVGPEVTEFKVGDRVAYFGGETYAEYTAAKVSGVEKISDQVSYDQAATVGLQALTAWTMVRDGYPVKKGGE